MSKSRVFTAIVAFVLSTTFVRAAIAAPAASIEQVRNGLATATTTPTPSWVTGNAGASNSHYLESHSIAYRSVMTNLPTDGTVVELIIGYAVKRSGSYAIDYLTQYQRLLPHVLFSHRDPEVINPLTGITGVGSTVTTAPIPLPSQNLMVDPDGANSDPAAPQPTTSMASLPGSERVMTLFGGTLIDVTYVTEGNVALATSSSETQIKVRFTANSPTAVLAWGGHIACRWDWGFNANGTPRSAGGISGSSYHMRLVTWNLGSVGNQDRSLSTDAVYPVPKCGVTNAGPFCSGTTNVHTAPSGMESYKWTLTGNTSGAAIVGSDSSASVTVFSGASGGTYDIIVTTGASGFTKSCDAIVTVNAPVTANAGLDQVACASSPQLQLAGVVSGGTAKWSGGAGTYNPSSSDPNAIYTPTASEITAGSVTLTLTCTPASGPCPTASDQVKLTFNRAATANAGADQVVCASSPQVQLAGVSGGGASSGSWSGGAGTFSPSASALNATYMPSADEITAASVTLTLTTDDPSGPCVAASDQMKITINPAATVNAGADQAVCASSPQVQLAGAVGGGAASGTWSGGAGTYSPNASTLNATYTPTAAEITAGGVSLALTTNDPSGPCGGVRDTMRITINRAATVNASTDQTVCASSPQVQLAGVVGGGAASGSWSGGAGTFSPSASALNATYMPTAAEIAAGSVTLTLTTNDPNGPCDAGSDQMKITINPAATANAGADQTVCASSPQVHLAGAVGAGAASGTWSGGAGTYSPNASTLNATYTPTAAEIAAGGVTLTLTTNDPAGPCGTVSDQVRITINPAATANAGPDQAVCSSSPQVQLSGVVGGGATGGYWSGGAGTFSPSRSALNATYMPSAAEIAAGNVTLTLATNDPAGPCPAVSDPMTITINPAAIVNAGADRRVCASSPQVQLAGTIGGGATSATWSGGAGAFKPNAAALNASYTPTAAEIAAGGVTLTLTTNDPVGPCPALSDPMRITIDPITVVNAGPDQTVCASSPQVQLQGSVSGTVTTGTWSGGAGTFSPGNVPNATYTPSPAEIAAGGVTLTLTSAPSSSPCPPASDAMRITINPAATVTAGPDQITCWTSPTVRLAGTIGGAATVGTWSGGLGTFDPNATTWNALYTPTPAEIASGRVTLTFTTNDPNGPCPPVSDQMVITYDHPTVAVPSKEVCPGMVPVSLCASVSNGVSPYAYLWSNGATTQCISVSDTGSYSVTITDAKGCQASATGGFHWRECPGMLAHTSTTCQQFIDGTASPIMAGDIHWNVSNGAISTISPGVFFYFSLVKAPSANFTIEVAQTKSNPAFAFIPVMQTQISLYDSNCNNSTTGAESSTGQASISVTGATPGQLFVVCVKYSLKALVGTPMGPADGCCYNFMTEVNGQVVDADPDGLVIGTVQACGVDPNNGGDTSGSGGSTGGGGYVGGSGAPVDPRLTRKLDGAGEARQTSDEYSLDTFRPVPNPFRDGMRMAYVVGTNGAPVSVRVYDVAGRLVQTLVDEFQSAGRHAATWDGRSAQGARLANGMYFIHVRIGGQVKQVRVTFLQ